MEGDMSGFDPTRTRRHVRYPVAIRDKQTWRGQDVENDPVRKFGVHATLKGSPRAASGATVRVSTENNFRARFPITLRERMARRLDKPTSKLNARIS